MLSSEPEPESFVDMLPTGDMLPIYSDFLVYMDWLGNCDCGENCDDRLFDMFYELREAYKSCLRDPEDVDSYYPIILKHLEYPKVLLFFEEHFFDISENALFMRAYDYPKVGAVIKTPWGAFITVLKRGVIFFKADGIMHQCEDLCEAADEPTEVPSYKAAAVEPLEEPPCEAATAEPSEELPCEADAAVEPLEDSSSKAAAVEPLEEPPCEAATAEPSDAQ